MSCRSRVNVFYYKGFCFVIGDKVSLVVFDYISFLKFNFNKGLFFFLEESFKDRCVVLRYDMDIMLFF